MEVATKRQDRSAGLQRVLRGKGAVATGAQMDDQGPQHPVDGVRLRPTDAGWQQALERAYASGVKPLCQCRPGGAPMYIARYQQFLVKRLPDTGHRHHPTCPSYEPPPSQSGLGEVLGDAVIERAPDRVEVRLDFPLTRTRTRPWREGEGVKGAPKKVRRRRRQPARSAEGARERS